MGRKRLVNEALLSAYSVEKLQNALFLNSCEGAAQSTIPLSNRMHVDEKARGRIHEEIAYAPTSENKRGR